MPTTFTQAICASMDAFDTEYWNLCQAAVWIEFRERDLVVQFAAAPGHIPDGDAYRALHFYLKMWPPERVLYADLNELHDRLKSNLLKALGYRRGEPNLLEAVPHEQWQDIDIRPPRALDARDKSKELWSHVRLERADILRLWPAPSSEKLDRTLFDWDELRSVYVEVRTAHPDISDNRTIQEIQNRFEKRHKNQKRKSPSRAALQARIKLWKTAAS